MAEGGPLPDDHVTKDNTPLLVSQLLECPICLEQIRNPKSLPCLHSFCEECLGTYIVTDMSGEMATVTSFPCPVCRKITSPVNHSEKKEMWAQQFSTNSLIQYFNNNKEMTNTPLTCSACKKAKDEETPARFLCEVTGTMFCEHCKINFHDFVHEACKIVTITESNQDEIRERRPVSVLCSTHKEKMDFYCEDHKFIGCNLCIITHHRPCNEVKKINEYCEKQKNNSRFDDMDKSLEKAASCLDLMLNAFDQKADLMQQCQEVGLDSISDLRQRLNKYLDEKQVEVTQELISKYKTEKFKLDLSKEKCTRLRATIQNTKEASRMALRRDDSLNVLLLFLRGQTEIGACNDLVDNITQILASVTMKHDIDPSQNTIDQASTLTMGRILVEEKPGHKPDGVGYIQRFNMLSESRVHALRRCNIKIPSDTYYCTAHGVLLMSNENILVSDYQHDKLILFSFEGQFLDELKIHGYLHDVCLVDADTVAVAVTSSQVGIHVVKVKPSQLTLSTVIKVPKVIECQGITFMDGMFWVGTDKAIHSVTMDGKVEKVQILSSPCWHLASDPENNHIIVGQQISTEDGIVVTRLTNGIDIYGLAERFVKDVMGVDVDREGNVYFCGKGSNNVVQVSANGTKVRELLTSKDGIDKPRAISVCRDKMVVTNESSKHRNEIHIYQLC